MNLFRALIWGGKPKAQREAEAWDAKRETMFEASEKRHPKIGHKRGCVTINCLGCGADFFSTDYR